MIASKFSIQIALISTIVAICSATVANTDIQLEPSVQGNNGKTIYDYDYEVENPFEKCIDVCRMPKSTEQWKAIVNAKQPFVVRRRERQERCADICICQAYHDTLKSAGVIESMENFIQDCVEKKPFTNNPADWPLFFGEQELAMEDYFEY